MKTFTIRTPRHTALVEITQELRSAAGAAGWRNGTLMVYIPHTTAGVTINEHADPDVARDLERRLDQMIPWDDPDDRHGEGNTAAHLKAALVGTSAAVFIEEGRLQLGTWQGVFFCEFDGPRTREVWLSFSPAAP